MTRFRLKIKFEDRLIVDEKIDDVEGMERVMKNVRRKFG